MATTRRFLIVLLFSISAIQAGSAGEPAHGIDQFVILVHPCPYEAMGKADTDPYRSLERAACDRWFATIPALPPSAFAVQVDFAAEGPSPDKLQRAFIERLGSGRVCRVGCEVVSGKDPDALRNYYGRINRQIAARMAAGQLTFDPATSKTVIWGQSFEGCAAGFGSAIATGLGLKTPTVLEYAMSAPDAPFLLDAEFLQNVSVPDSDVEAYLFDLKDGRCAALFRSRLTPQWLDHRPIELPLDAKIFSVVTKRGEPVWPNGIEPTPVQKADSSYYQWRTVVWPEGTRPPGPMSFTLATVQERYVITAKPHLQALITAIRTASVKPQAE